MEPVRRWSTPRWVAIDAAGVLVGSLAAGAMWPATPVGRGPGWAGGLVTLVALAAAAGRRVLPPAVLAGAAIVVAALVPAGYVGAATVAAAVLMYPVPGRLPGAAAGVVLGAGVAACLAATTGFLRAAPDPPGRWGIGTVAVPALVLVASWAAGSAADRNRRYLAARHERRLLAERAQVAVERQALAEERLRIAREVHDVVAHTLAVIAVQAGVAGHVADENPGEARRALGSIEDTSREALTEMRGLLAVLRPDHAETGAPAPAPGLADLPALAARSEAAGVRVELSVQGAPRPLSGGADLAAYRVVQEAVTNVLRHARTDRCRVRLCYRPAEVVIEVQDEGCGPRSPRTGGHGLVGMRERLAMYGGQVTAGAGSGGGFRVTARLPTPGAAA